MFPANLPQFALSLPWSCSCLTTLYTIPMELKPYYPSGHCKRTCVHASSTKFTIMYSEQTAEQLIFAYIFMLTRLLRTPIFIQIANILGLHFQCHM